MLKLELTLKFLFINDYLNKLLFRKVKREVVMRKIMVLFIAILISIFSCTESNKILEIGGILPLTGDLAIYGKKMKRGIDLAVEEINQNGGINGLPIKMIYENDQGESKVSVVAMQKLITVNKVEVIIGGAISSTALPAVPIAERNEVVLFSPAATSPKLTRISSYFFRNWPSDIYDGTAMGRFAAIELKLNNSAVLFVNNEWGLAISDIYKKTFKKNGGTILISESYEQNSADFRSQLTKIKTHNPEAIYIPGYLKELINILIQKQELGIEAKILSAYGFYDPQILEKAGKAAEGAIFTVPTYSSESDDIKIQDYVNKFNDKYGEEPDIWSAQAYDALMIISNALKKGAKTGKDIRDELLKIEKYDGVSGETSFDKNGEVIKPLKFMIVKNGKFVEFN